MVGVVIYVGLNDCASILPCSVILQQGLRFPVSHLKALRQLQEVEELTVAELELPSDEAKVNMALALWTESLLEVCETTIWNVNKWNKLIVYFKEYRDTDHLTFSFFCEFYFFCGLGRQSLVLVACPRLELSL